MRQDFMIENLLKVKTRMSNQILIQNHNLTAKFACRVCKTGDLPFSTITSLHQAKNNSGADWIIALKPIVENGVVSYPEDAFIVCSEVCRKEFLKNCSYYDILMDDVDIPARVSTSLARLDKLHNAENWEKVEKIKSKLDSQKGFYIQGIPGSGKTVLAAALAWEYRKRELSVKFVTYKELHFALFTNFDIERNINRLVYRDNGDPWNVVIVDDVTTSFPGTFGAERMILLFDEWYNNNTKLIMTSNESAEIVGKAIHERVLSRMNEIMIPILWPSKDYRVL